MTHGYVQIAVSITKLIMMIMIFARNVDNV